MHEIDSVPLSDTRFFYWLLICLAMYPVVQFVEWVFDILCCWCFCRRRSQFNIGWGNVNSNGNQSLYRRGPRKRRQDAQDKDPEDPASSEDDSDSD